jgi:hypothetical protein
MEIATTLPAPAVRGAICSLTSPKAARPTPSEERCNVGTAFVLGQFNRIPEAMARIVRLVNTDAGITQQLHAVYAAFRYLGDQCIVIESKSLRVDV